GAVLGQRSVITEEVANLSAIAVNDMEVCFVPKDAIMDSLNSNPNFAVEVLRHIAHDLKEADDVIVNMSQKTVKQRIAEAFIYLEENFGKDKNGYLALTLSREDIANVVGTATESAIRIISDFKKLGLIKASGKKVAIADRNGLNEVAKGS
ncbi:MAG TPA: Crp/Fnr family transcriptional regulator, partial [Arenibacter sp.]|nr:Crp/Fnr family transcriptional regulator [Arenibacter sp.]